MFREVRAASQQGYYLKSCAAELENVSTRGGNRWKSAVRLYWGSITAPIDLRGVVGGILQTCEGTRFRTSGGNSSVSA